MFGMHYIYWQKKIMMILRRRLNEPEFNGVWVATNKLHHDSLREPTYLELWPSSVGGNEQTWYLAGNSATGIDAFEEAAIKVCELRSLHGDTRIGNLTEKAPL